jgi:hypothetical protein
VPDPKFFPCTRETTTSTGFADYVLGGAMYGSIRFVDTLGTVGQVTDYVCRYQDQFEEGLGTLAFDGSNWVLQRTVITCSRHTGGTVDTTKVNWPSGAKVIVGTLAGWRAAYIYTIANIAQFAIRYDSNQGLSAAQQAQARNNLPPFPSGVRLLFRNLFVPSGWTLDASNNDRVIRVVSFTSEGTGGVQGFSTVFGNTATGGHALTQAELPNVNFTLAGGGAVTDTQVRQIRPLGQRTDLQTGGAAAAATTFGGTHNGETADITSGGANVTNLNVPSGGSGAQHTHDLDLRVQYVDAFWATKD